ncbi:MAG: DUF2490 domain-containing protein [Lewinellaceae bacterium]|nr:DUF2490 domain-containing protein [Saprospiraceae bacterium]MCB9334174.1 DUF2490 domain-containing protein [Lewinellaceae bacterium]
MQKPVILCFLFVFNLFTARLYSQPDECQLGAWYMYFWNTAIKSGPWGFQGDVQVRSWNIAGDLEQLLLRGGLTYQPANNAVKFTLGYGHVQTGAFGPEKTTSAENRCYLEALLPQKIGERFYLTHRFRYEQRWVENQDFRTRFRYNLFLNIPLNRKDLQPGAIYLALYNELFINGQRDIGDGREVELFDRNRAYAALGYSLTQGLRVQLGIMQQTTDAWEKRQAQLSLHHTF